MAPPDPAQLAVENARRADDVVDAIVAHGVDVVFVAPGSRSTPLVLALGRREVPTHVLLDERAAGFCAVGAARVGRLAAIVTTSGTAVANLLPACAEAERDGLGVLCCTADRALNDVERGASQTLRQPPLLAGVARAVVDLPAPDGTGHVDVRAELDDALGSLRGVEAGPVHLNVRFDKPLEPPPGWKAAGARPVPRRVSTSSQGAGVTLPEAGVVVVGALPLAARAAVARALARLGWPVIADVTSGLDALPPTLHRVPTVALRSTSVRRAWRPRSVLWIGGLVVEDTIPLWVRSLRERGDCPVVQVTFTGTRRDPFDIVDRVAVVDAQHLADALGGLPQPEVTTTSLPQRLAAGLQPVLETVAAGPLTEPAVARVVAAAPGAGETLLLGNSMPVRDVDRFGAVREGVCVIANRGAAGIDGCVATALGASLATGRPTTALLGDLAVLHDLSSLAALATTGAPVRVVVVNNGGGGIFSFLPVSGAIDAATMTRFFETPHDLALAPVARALGLAVRVADDVAALTEALREPPARPELIEVRTRRDDNVVVHRRLDEAIEAAMAAELTGSGGVV